MTLESLPASSQWISPKPLMLSRPTCAGVLHQSARTEGAEALSRCIHRYIALTLSRGHFCLGTKMHLLHHLGDEWGCEKTCKQMAFTYHRCQTMFLIIVSFASLCPWNANKRFLSTVYVSIYPLWLHHLHQLVQLVANVQFITVAYAWAGCKRIVYCTKCLQIN